MDQIRLLICDMGGTLRRFHNPVQASSSGRQEDWVLCPGVAQALEAHAAAGGFLGIATNQPRIALGQCSVAHVHGDITAIVSQALPSWATGRRLMSAMGSRGIGICPHGPDDGCPCRKPSPYLLLRVAQHFYQSQAIRLGQILYVGDEPCDQEAAEHASIAFEWAHTFFGHYA